MRKETDATNAPARSQKEEAKRLSDQPEEGGRLQRFKRRAQKEAKEGIKGPRRHGLSPDRRNKIEYPTEEQVRSGGIHLQVEIKLEGVAKCRPVTRESPVAPKIGDSMEGEEVTRQTHRNFSHLQSTEVQEGQVFFQIL